MQLLPTLLILPLPGIGNIQTCSAQPLVEAKLSLSERLYFASKVYSTVEIYYQKTLNVAATNEVFPDGAPFEGIGIKPDIEIVPTVEDLRKGNDVMLRKALELAQPGRP